MPTRKGLRVVLIIDEAQDLSIDALEQVRLLTNLETDTQKLLQIILLGQPELRTHARARRHAPARAAHHRALPPDAAGCRRNRALPAPSPSRSPAACTCRSRDRRCARLHAHSGGVPRLINVIAERACSPATRATGRAWTAAPSTSPRAKRCRRCRAGAQLVPLFGGLAIAILLVAGFVVFRSPGARPVVPSPARVVHAAPKAPPPTPRPVPPPKPPVLDADALAERIASLDPDMSPAWRALLSAWQLPTGDSDVAIAMQCAPSLGADVSCLRARASLDALATIGRPVLLRLHAARRDAWALLDRHRCDPRRALQLGDAIGRRSARCAPAGVARRLRGDLATVDADTADPSDPADVRAFQASHGLVADGVVGPETRFALSADGPGPHLLRELR